MPLSVSEADMNGDIRALLNDTAANIYSNTVLLPYFKIEYGKLIHFIVESGLPYLRTFASFNTTANVAATISRATVGGAFVDMIAPVQIWARLAGSAQDFTPIREVSDDLEFQNMLISSNFPQDNPNGWQWAESQINIGGSKTARELRIQFYRYTSPYPYALTAGYTITDLIDFREYLAHRTGALATMMIGRDATRATALVSEATSIGERIKGRMIKEGQSLPIRQRPFWHSRKHRSIIT